VDGAGAAVGDRGADGAGRVTECARVGATECGDADDGEGAEVDVVDEGADVDVVDEGADVDVVDEGVNKGAETPALPHPTANKATSISAAIFRYVTISELRITS